MDVLTHALEAYVSNMANDYSDALAEKATKLVFENLKEAYFSSAIKYSYLGNDVNLVGLLPLYSTTYGNKIALILPCGKWNFAPNLCAIEWHIPKNAFVNAIPAIVLALCILSLANLLSPWLYASF